MKDQNKFTLYYKIFLIFLIISQITLFIIEMFIYISYIFVLNGISAIYLIFRLWTLIKMEKEAKINGKSVRDYMESFKNRLNG